MTQPSPYKGHFEAPDATRSIVVTFDLAQSANYPALRFPSPGRIVGAWFISNVSSSGTNLIRAAVLNGGVTGAGTIITGASTSGTVTAGSAYALSIANGGTELYDT